MTINLTSYTAIQSNLCVRIEVPEYRTSAGDAYESTVLRFSDSPTTKTINDEDYIGLGNLMSITGSSSELRVSGGELTISITGIPSTSIGEIVNSKIKGCSVRIYRIYSSATNGATLNITGNPSGRYRGFINNYSLIEEWDNETRTSTNTISLICASAVDVLQNKISGRRTNPESMKKYYPLDISMDRVPNLENSTFNFGAPQ